MRRVRICQLITELGLGGAERILYELVKRIDRQRFDVQVASLRGGEVREWIAQVGVRTRVLGVRGKWDATKLPALVELLRRERIDILHTHLFHADLVGRAAKYLAGVPHLVHTVHTAEARWRPWQFAFGRLTAGLCERIVAVSPSVRDFHARRSGLPPHRYLVIPNGVDPSAYERDGESRLRLRALWKVAPDDVLVAFVGRLSEEKGVETLLAAMRKLGSPGEAPGLVIAGDGPRRKTVERFIAAEAAGRRIRLLGFTADVRGVLSAADIFAAPSRWEGFGLAAAEAMAASLPVVATRVEGLRDLVVEGQTGLLIAPDDPDALADRIMRLARDAELRERLGRAGRSRLCSRFNIAANIGAHEALYAELIETPGD